MPYNCGVHLENPNSVTQMRLWLADNGLQTDTLGKKAVTEMLKTAPPLLAEVLVLRQQLAKSSVKKYNIDEIIDPRPPLHYNCRCEIKTLRSIKAGNATKNGNDGADYWIKYFGDLPKYYVTKDFAYSVGWRDGKSPSKYAFGKMIFGGIYNNSNGHLPDAPGRIWYEADINYYEGKRNGHRLLWSNDGLMFVTYNHYETFYEII